MKDLLAVNNSTFLFRLSMNRNNDFPGHRQPSANKRFYVANIYDRESTEKYIINY